MGRVDPAIDDIPGRRAGRVMTVAGIVLILVTLAIAAVTIWNLRHDAEARAMREADSHGILLAEQNARLIQAIQLVLSDTQRMVLAAGATTPQQFSSLLASEQIHERLVKRMEGLPQADAISLIDGDGKVVNFSRSWPAPSIDTSGREYFKALRDDDKSGIFIGRPFRNSTNGHWDLPIELRVDGPQGQFLGLVNTMVEARYFEQLYEKLATHEGESVALFRDDGTMLARYPHLEKMMGEKLPPSSPWYRIVGSHGTYRNPESIDGMVRIVSVHPLDNMPLAVAVTMSEDVELADWRHQSLLIIIGAGCSTFGLLTFLVLLRAQFRRLQMSHARFRGFALTSSDWFWETDELHRLSYMSEGVSTTGFGIKPKDLIGRTRREIAADAGSEVELWRKHQATLERHEPFRDFSYNWQNPGGQGTASISGDPVFDRNRRFLGYRGTGRDISPQINAERTLLDAKEAAEAANLAKSQFLANISHELRTPLNAVIGFAEMIKEGFAGPLRPKQDEYVALILQSGRHLLKVINDILDLARADAGKFVLHDEEGVNFGEIVTTCMSLTKHQADARGLITSTAIEEDLPPLIADPTRLQQILLNLLSNAIRFTKSPGSVVVAARRTAEGGIMFEVSDTGAGMTQPEIEIALEPFGQVDARLAREHEGTGLGLPLARRLTELHGGTLHVASDKGRGTTVTVVLPAERVMHAAACADDTAATAETITPAAQ